MEVEGNRHIQASMRRRNVVEQCAKGKALGLPQHRFFGLSEARENGAATLGFRAQQTKIIGMRIVFELKRGEQAEVILNNLYKHTQLQINFGVIMLSIVNGQPRELGLVDVLRRFIDHRIDVVRRRTDFLLRKARDREHILLGFKKALDNLDAVIKLIRGS